MVFRVTKIIEIEAAHQLVGYNGPCANMHGHSYKIEISMQSEKLNHNSMVIDFKTLKDIMKKHIDKYDHSVLNETMTTTRMFPTAENMCKEIFINIQAFINTFPRENGAQITKVKIWETSSSFAEYEAD